MKRSFEENRREIMHCIKIGINMKSTITQNVLCGSRTVQNTLIELEKQKEIRSERIGTTKHYFLTYVIPYHDPFGLARWPKNTNTFALPPRQKHSMDEKRDAR